MVIKQLDVQINNLNNKVSDLTTSLESSQREFDGLKAQAKKHDKEKKEDKAVIENLEEKVISQDYCRRKNLRIGGPEERDET